MVDYSLSANTPASNMDGGGTDLALGDTVTTNAYKLTLDIACGFKGLTISNGGEVEVQAYIYQISDHRDAQLDALAGSIISNSGLGAGAPAVFISERGDGVMPVNPWWFSCRGTMDLPYTRMSGNLWTLRNATYATILKYGSAKIIPTIPANIISNNIQGGIGTIKWIGNRPRTYQLQGLLWDTTIYSEQYWIDLMRSGESFSIMTDRIHLDSVKMTSLIFTPLGLNIQRYVMGLMEAV